MGEAIARCTGRIKKIVDFTPEDKKDMTFRSVLVALDGFSLKITLDAVQLGEVKTHFARDPNQEFIWEGKLDDMGKGLVFLLKKFAPQVPK